MSPDRRRWVLLAYRVPREPSTPRIAVWRKLRRLGVAQIVDGLVAVPDSVSNLEQMGWIANDVLDADGEAQLWTAELNSAKQERELVARLNREVDRGVPGVRRRDRGRRHGHRARRAGVSSTASNENCATSCDATTSAPRDATVPSVRSQRLSRASAAV